MIGPLQPPSSSSFFIFTDEFSSFYGKLLSLFSEATEEEGLNAVVPLIERDVVLIEEVPSGKIEVFKQETEGQNKSPHPLPFLLVRDKMNRLLKQCGFFSSGSPNSSSKGLKEKVSRFSASFLLDKGQVEQKIAYVLKLAEEAMKKPLSSSDSQGKKETLQRLVDEIPLMSREKGFESKVLPLLHRITRVCVLLSPEVTHKNPLQFALPSVGKEGIKGLSHKLFKGEGKEQVLIFEGKEAKGLYPHYRYEEKRPVPVVVQLQGQSKEAFQERILQKAKQLGEQSPFSKLTPFVFALEPKEVIKTPSFKKGIAQVSVVEKKKEREQQVTDEKIMLLAFVPEEDPLFAPPHHYAIGVYPVTRQQFAGYLNYAFSQNVIRLQGTKEIVSHEGTLLCQLEEGLELIADADRPRVRIRAGKEYEPITFVTYFGAEAFCRAGGFRLPSLLEWEKAASWLIDIEKKTIHRFSYGCSHDEIRPTLANYGKSHPSDIGFFNGKNKVLVKGHLLSTENAESPYGCYDMSGNVAEWVATEGREAVIKGGSFHDPQESLKVLYSPLKPKLLADAYTGFRVTL